MVGAGRVAAEDNASREVVRLCGGVPLAVCVSGARLAAHPGWPVSRIARELAVEHVRLSALSLRGDLSVRAAFDASYQALPDSVAFAYRAVAQIPGADFPARRVLATAALDDRENSQGLLDALADASLLTETAGGRYRMHDLIRLHAREQPGPGEQHSVITRSVAWYLARGGRGGPGGPSWTLAPGTAVRSGWRGRGPRTAGQLRLRSGWSRTCPGCSRRCGPRTTPGCMTSRGSCARPCGVYCSSGSTTRAWLASQRDRPAQFASLRRSVR